MPVATSFLVGSSAAGVMTRPALTVSAMSRYARSKAASLSRSRVTSEPRDSRCSATGWAIARLTACSSSRSTLNPYNARDVDGFAYGMVPLFLARACEASLRSGG